MARSRTGESGGVSLEKKDQTSGLFGPGEATIEESVFAKYTYQSKGGKQSPVANVWLLTFDRDGEKHEQPYSIGDGWKISADGESLIPQNGQTGLSDACNASRYLVNPLMDAGFPEGRLGSNPRVLEGMKVVLDRVVQEERTGGNLNAPPRPDGRPRTILVIKAIEQLPWEAGNGAKPLGSKKKATAKDEDEDEPKPTRRGRTVEVDEEEDAPKGRSGKGKASKQEDEDREEASEALIEAIEKYGDDGTLDVDDIEKSVKKIMKGKANAEDIAAIAASDDLLETENGWAFNAKKGTVTLQN